MKDTEYRELQVILLKILHEHTFVELLGFIADICKGQGELWEAFAKDLQKFKKDLG